MEILWGFAEKFWFLRGRGSQKTIYKGELSNKGGLGEFPDLREAWWRSGWYPNAQYDFISHRKQSFDLLYKSNYQFLHERQQSAELG